MARIFLGILVGVFITTQSLAQSDEANGAYLAAALTAAEAREWDAASEIAGRISDPTGADVIQWLRLRKGGAPLGEYFQFLKEHSDWPGLKLMRLKGEGSIPGNHKPSEVLAYFEGQSPQTGIGAIRLAEAYEVQGNKEAAKKEVIRVWREYSLTRNQRETLLARYGDTLKPHHAERLDMLLWRGLSKQAEAMMSRVSSELTKLAKARIGLRKQVGGVDGLINAISDNYKTDPGLAYERFLWRVKKKRRIDAQTLLIERSVSADSLGKPERWSNRRRQYARREMRDGNANLAYQIASNHFLTSGSDYADLEWLSGFIALRQLDDPARALTHFDRFRAAIATPISYGRAGYWQGRAYEAMGDVANADMAYQFAAQYQTSFYGQLAAEKAGVPADEALNGKETFADWRQADFVKGSVVRAGLLLHFANEPELAERFFKQEAEAQDRTGLLQLTDLALDIGRPNITVRVAKKAARRGHVLPVAYFPLTGLATMQTNLAPEIAMSIARRESELNQHIISPAGARGLMQLMPATAQKVSRDLGLSYSKARLTSDWKYNATLGSAYLAEQLEDFDGSYILSFAAYNAGPHRSRSWIQKYGDPRSATVDQIDWIEHIPFRETRNYVMRVMESLHVYRARLSGKVQPLRISKDLQKG